MYPLPELHRNLSPKSIAYLKKLHLCTPIADVFGSYLVSADKISEGTSPPFYAYDSKGSISTWALENKSALGMMPEMAQQMILGGIEHFAYAQQPVNEIF